MIQYSINHFILNFVIEKSDQFLIFKKEKKPTDGLLTTIFQEHLLGLLGKTGSPSRACAVRVNLIQIEVSSKRTTQRTGRV